MKSKRANLVKHTFHRSLGRSVSYRPPPPLLSANCQPDCPLPIHLSSRCLLSRRIHLPLSSLRRAASFSLLSRIRRLLSANASPPVGLLFASWLSCHPCCRAAAASCPFSTLPPPLVLLTCSLPRDKPPPPRDTPPPLVSWHLSSRLPLF